MKTALRSVAAFAVVALVGLTPGGQAPGLPSTKNGDWTHYTADVHGTKYSPLDQITAANFNQLEVAWKFKTDNLGTRPAPNPQATPPPLPPPLHPPPPTRPPPPPPPANPAPLPRP